MRSIHAVFLIGTIVALSATGGRLAVMPAFATTGQEEWKAEFDDICSKTDGAATLTAAEVRGLIERCDKLKPQIEKLDESARKVYLRRLASCRALFQFMIDSKALK